MSLLLALAICAYIADAFMLFCTGSTMGYQPWDRKMTIKEMLNEHCT
jgi:hypothetical protein